MKFGLVAILALALTGCAYQAKAPSVNVSDAVMSSNRSDGTAYVLVREDLKSFTTTVKPGFVCSAHSYPLEIGPAIYLSIVQVMEGAYANVSPVSSREAAKNDGPLFVFESADIEPRLRFHPGFFAATAEANVSVGIRSVVYSRDGAEVNRVTIRGTGTSDVSGQCGDGADVLGTASQKAIRSSLESFADKVLNSPNRPE